ncbi:MAG: response regulator [Bdellovibrionota bacterium]|jgi:DNA-binding NtrC family response regulator
MEENNKKRLLLIDDEEGVLRALTLMLSAFGYEVFPFSDPIQALRNLSELSPDWIITDLRMPGIDGFGVIEKRNAEHPEIPVILISGHAQEEEIRKANELGIRAFLPKPFDPAALTRILHE